jgi:hypothetical protein
MNAGADVRSLEALEHWYGALAQFRAEGQNAMTTLALSLQHASAWLEDQHTHWHRAIRQAEDEVSRARIELHNRQYQSFTGEKLDTTVQEKELRAAEAELDFAQERLSAVRRWMHQLPQVVQDLYQGPSRRLEFCLDVTLAQTLAQLGRHLSALEQYLGRKPSPRLPTADPPSQEPT